MDEVGKIISDIQRLNGTFEGPESFNDRAVIKGRGPVSTFMDYPLEFIATTKGKGRYTFIFEGYDICHNTEEVVKMIAYDKNADSPGLHIKFHILFKRTRVCSRRTRSRKIYAL